MTGRDRTAPLRAVAAAPPHTTLAVELGIALERVFRKVVIEVMSELAAPPRPELLDRAGLAEALHVSPATISRLVTEGLPRIMVCDSPRYRLSDCIAFLERRTRERQGTGEAAVFEPAETSPSRDACSRPVAESDAAAVPAVALGVRLARRGGR